MDTRGAMKHIDNHLSIHKKLEGYSCYPLNPRSLNRVYLLKKSAKKPKRKRVGATAVGNSYLKLDVEKNTVISIKYRNFRSK